MKLKENVDISGLRREIRGAFGIIDQVHKDLSEEAAGVRLEAIVTSATGGRHSVKRSAHYRGDAVDLRTWHVDGDSFADRLTEELGPDYVVLSESDHVHVHWGPVWSESS